MREYTLRLYISGSNARSAHAIENLRSICEQELEGRYRMEVIDVMEDPDAAEEAEIIATPTLIKSLPPPLLRIIGDLTEKENLLLGLELVPAAE
ncbi:circadian clock KaiB family protein [Thiocapsa bogorovii]|uniref:circadian clock KaiB family protein n=1 Tax=Thiocapsa bogorovii TaxID=521689 RepID=UPI001E4965A9|nr:circadian clock KaiB family protein [Thiocapsa bogorovii]UHD15155.1 circadian clock protein KaiB [Thiocapsa bogorovii]